MTAPTEMPASTSGQPAAEPHRHPGEGRGRPQLDHDGDRKPGGARKPPAQEWVVTRARGLHQVLSSETAAVLRAGGRMATARDLKVAGVDAA